MANPPDPPAPTNPASPSFEEALAELEGIVAAMESGHLPLQESLDAYKRGAELLRQCRETLDAAERQIRILEGEELRDFDPPGASSQEG
jgi:exodeoxyribonuclease VII small subunit